MKNKLMLAVFVVASLGSNLFGAATSVLPDWICCREICRNILMARFGQSGEIKTFSMNSGIPEIKCWECSSGNCLGCSYKFAHDFNPKKISPDGRLEIRQSSDNAIEIFDIKASRSLFTLTHADAGVVKYSAFSPDGTCILVLTEDGVCFLWEDTRISTTKKQILQLIFAGHSRCGVDSPANILPAYVFQNIYEYLECKPFEQKS